MLLKLLSINYITSNLNIIFFIVSVFQIQKFAFFYLLISLFILKLEAKICFCFFFETIFFIQIHIYSFKI